MQRIIGEHGNYNSGKLFIIFASIHGNEQAGYHALKRLFNFLETNKVNFQGKIIGLIGNVSAFELDQRFIHKDLNRQWYASKIIKLSALPYGLLNTSEDIEQKQLLDNIQSILHQQTDKEDILMLDLHTTSASGACMSITNTHKDSVEFAKLFPSPVIDKMTSTIYGTTLEYFDRLNIPAIAFESGQHIDPQSADRAFAALVSLFLGLKIIDKKYENNFKEIIEDLRKYNENLPFVSEVKYHHLIDEEDDFIMQPGYVNFQEVKEGELLAHDKNGEIRCAVNGKILMPLYQKKGSDGFFIVN
ncbi:MAG: succinylglutamate desuccinylase [Planctomycetota bacterium]|jgi:succinylglutamate desuccinylase